MLLRHRSLRNYRTPSYIVPRAFDRFAAVALLGVLYFGLGERPGQGASWRVSAAALSPCLGRGEAHVASCCQALEPSRALT